MYTVITNGVGPGANLDDDIVINEASLDRAKHEWYVEKKNVAKRSKK